jgi:hypothetical protein
MFYEFKEIFLPICALFYWCWVFFLSGQQVFWHSSAHILGEAMERVYGGCLCYGPPLENGFYYDMFIDDKQVRLFCYHEPVDLISELNMFASIIRFHLYSTYLVMILFCISFRVI